MPGNKFKFSKTLSSQDSVQVKEKLHLDELNAQADYLRTEHNKLVAESFRVEQQITDCGESVDSNLLQLKNTLKDELQKHRYRERLEDINEKIKNAEIALYGQTNIGSRSPY